jgi:hypothetical protein
MAPKHKIVVWNPKCRYTIYKMIHHKTKNPIYVGQTGNTSRRKAGYRATVKAELKKSEKIKTLIVAYVEECQSLNINLRLETMSEFPDGVPADRADGFEALMIHDLKTASACGTGGKNTSCGNCLALHEPRFDEYRAELPYVWSPTDLAMRDAVAPEVVAAQSKLVALEDVQDMMQEASDKPTPVLDEQVKGALVAVDDAMRKFMGPLQLAETLSKKYEGQLDVLPVDPVAFEVDLNALRDRFNEEAEPDKDLVALCRATELMIKRPVTAGFVAHMFLALAKVIQAIEEAKLPKCDALDLAKEIRQVLASTHQDWMRSRTNKDTTLQEKKVYGRLQTWKTKVFKTQAEDVPSQVAAMRFILRSNPTWVQKFDAWLQGQAEVERMREVLDRVGVQRCTDAAGALEPTQCGCGVAAACGCGKKPPCHFGITQLEAAAGRLGLALPGVGREGQARLITAALWLNAAIPAKGMLGRPHGTRNWPVVGFRLGGEVEGAHADFDLKSALDRLCNGEVSWGYGDGERQQLGADVARADPRYEGQVEHDAHAWECYLGYHDVYYDSDESGPQVNLTNVKVIEDDSEDESEAPPERLRTNEPFVPYHRPTDEAELTAASQRRWSQRRAIFDTMPDGMPADEQVLRVSLALDYSAAAVDALNTWNAYREGTVASMLSEVAGASMTRRPRRTQTRHRSTPCSLTDTHTPKSQSLRDARSGRLDPLAPTLTRSTPPCTLSLRTPEDPHTRVARGFSRG